MDLLELLSSDLQPTLTALVQQTGPHHDLLNRWIEQPNLVRMADASSTQQKWWASHVANIRVQRLKVMGTARDQVRLIAQEGAISSA